jgi:hypothetical protein
VKLTSILQKNLDEIKNKLDSITEENERLKALEARFDQRQR